MPLSMRPVAFIFLLAGCCSGPGRAYHPEGARARRIAVVPDEHRPTKELAPLYEAARRGGARHGLTLVPDAALEDVAKEILPTIGEDGEPPPVPVVEFATR